jgi:peptidoglycan/xylan/chitin deacetylase (PgdA/CDA1 family)
MARGVNNSGKFIISLDYELFWGVRDVSTKETYGQAILNVDSALRKMMQLFELYNIRVTMATVGFLFHREAKELLANIPEILPDYNNSDLSPYPDLEQELSDQNAPYYFNWELTKLLKDSPNVEMASHTYSHYYCLESRNDQAAFNADIAMAVKVANNNRVALRSMVFPRNQYSEEHIHNLKKFGFTSYRGNPKHWIYKSVPGNEQFFTRRILRLLDAYFNITGHHCHSMSKNETSTPVNIPASRFLRPYSKVLAFFEALKIARIKKSMSYAAKNNKLFHLWWHPHNFGINTDENLKGLQKILDHYKKLNDQYDFESITMEELSDKIVKSQ